MEKRPILWEICRYFSEQISLKMIAKKNRFCGNVFGQILLESDWFCTDLTNVLTKKDGNFAFFSEMMSVSLCNNNSNRTTDYL